METDTNNTEGRLQVAQAAGRALDAGDWHKPSTLDDAMKLAKLIANSNFCPQGYKGKAGDVLVAIQMGAEVGLGAMSALQNIAVINGRPSIWGDGMLALVQSAPDYEDIQESFDADTMTATCKVKRKDKSWVQATFSQSQAKKAGLWGKKGPWQQYPERMLQMRARGFALRDGFADRLRGMITAEEARDIPVQAEARVISEEAYDSRAAAITAQLDQAAKESEPEAETADPGVAPADAEQAGKARAEAIEEIRTMISRRADMEGEDAEDIRIGIEEHFDLSFVEMDLTMLERIRDGLEDRLKDADLAEQSDED